LRGEAYTAYAAGKARRLEQAAGGKPRQTPGRSALRFRVDLDEFVQAGPSVQLTWMDARVRDCVMTSRICKAMEVEVLWIPRTGGRVQRWRRAPGGCSFQARSFGKLDPGATGRRRAPFSKQRQPDFTVGHVAPVGVDMGHGSRCADSVNKYSVS
jgi:Amylo-alpha-1,6-glucosidase